jgi:hypothetical protein
MRIRRWITGGLISAGIVGAGAGLWLMQSTDSRAEVISVENPTIVVDDLPAQEARELIFRVHNDGAESLQIVGYERCCTAEGCFGPNRSDNIPLPAGKTVELAFELRPSRPGPFRITCPLYVRDRGGLREIELCATGTAVSAVAAAPVNEVTRRP